MSIPYESDTVARAANVPIDAWIEKPFSERMDNTTTEYKIKCSCKRENYTSIPFTRVMDNATNAGLLELPFAANANAYFFGDENFQSDDGDLITFVRTFGTKPIDITYMESDYNYGFPAFKSWFGNSSMSTTQRFFANLGNDIPQIENRRSFNATVTGRYEYTYHISNVNGTNINPDTPFEITCAGLTTKKAISGYGTFYIDIAASSKLNYVNNSFSGGVTWPATSPTQSQYETYITNGTYLIAESSTRHYKGNIFEKRTVKVKAL